MTYVPLTPFRRTITAACLEHQKYTDADLPPQGVNKYEIMRELTTARRLIGVSDRELTVLQALLSFHPETVLGGSEKPLLVYPSNAAICERLNGMACSTMRRHLAGLVDAGLIVRRDSPNGKRYVKRVGGDAQAFGFDLTPLVARSSEIYAAAETTRADADRYQRLRQSVSLMRRDLAGLAAFGLETRPEVPVWDRFFEIAATTARALRRKLAFADLQTLEAGLLAALDHARDVFECPETAEMSINEAQSEHHLLNSDKDLYVLEPCLENHEADEKPEEQEPEPDMGRLPNIPISMVLSVCTEFTAYVPERIRHWHELVRAAETVRPMMGISKSAWDEAARVMGPEEAAVVILAMLERFADIKSPGGYLRYLARQAHAKAFSCGPMVMALMRRDAA